ncbi:efflux RND transporter permease subunit [candidate division WOR-3 bacterium]|nr:efflux RND transporter permease subunit [candidate division WOR-3 bacterium]
MNFIDIAVKRPYMTLMFYLALVVIGVFSLTRIPQDMFPNIEIPQLTVLTVYPGASCENVERLVTKPLEEVLAGAPGIKHINSWSKDNISIIQLEFNYGTDINSASSDIREFVDFAAENLPADAKRPRIMKISTGHYPILYFGIKYPENMTDIDDVVNNLISDRIQRSEGVANVLTLNLPQKEILITIRPSDLRKYCISIEQIKNALGLQNITIPAGNTDIGTMNWSVSVPADLSSIREIALAPVSVQNGNIIRLRDIASVRDTISASTSSSMVDGQKGVILVVMKQSGANSVQVSKSVKQTIERLKKDLPPGVEIELVQDYSSNITNIIGNLEQTILIVLIAVVIVVFFFLRKLIPGLIVTLSIPASIVIVFIGLFAFGYSFNAVSLMSIAVAIGMIVDNAIVVLENIDKHREKSKDMKQASINGAKEMAPAVIAATLTTVIVFLPLIFVRGLVGILFQQLAFVIIVTIGSSVITALTLTPMLTSKLEKEKTINKKDSKFYRYSEKAFNSTESFYSRILDFALRHKYAVLASSGTIFVLSLLLVPFVGTGYFSSIDTGELTIIINTPSGTSLEETENVTKQVFETIDEVVKDKIIAFSIEGQDEKGLLSTAGFDEGSNIATILVRLKPIEKREVSSEEIAKLLRERIADIPNISKYSVSSQSIMLQLLLGGTKEIEIQISGENLAEINATALTIAQSAKTIQGVADVTSTTDNGRPELRIVIDKDKALSLGLTPMMIAMQIRQSLHGQEAGYIVIRDTHRPIFITYEEQSKDNAEKLKDIVLTTALGKQVALGDIAVIERHYAQIEITRKDRTRTVTVMLSLFGKSMGQISSELSRMIGNMDIPDGVNAQIAGQTQEQKETFTDLATALIIGIILVYMVMCAQFGSFRDPFIIMFSIPFTFTGVILAFLLTRNELNMITSIGVIMLMGIVVNNGIVLIDRMNILKNSGKPVLAAVKEGGKSRLRPVLMTVLTTVIALMPLAVSRKQGHEIWSPFATTALGGLLFSTLVTLIVVPVMYSVFHRDKKSKVDSAQI